MWVFGYGSLVWKVDFPYESKLVGYVKGYVRRFYQHSIDHRGVPEKPGRVVTLIETGNKNDQVCGVAYKIRTEEVQTVTDHLDFREKNGYTKKVVLFYPLDGETPPFQLTLYVATEDNDSYAGPAPVEDIASQVISCRGPSGTNKEYVYKLAEAMRNLAPGCIDEHLYSLEKVLKEIDPDFKKHHS